MSASCPLRNTTCACVSRHKLGLTYKNYLTSDFLNQPWVWFSLDPCLTQKDPVMRFSPLVLYFWRHHLKKTFWRLEKSFTEIWMWQLFLYTCKWSCSKMLAFLLIFLRDRYLEMPIFKDVFQTIVKIAVISKPNILLIFQTPIKNIYVLKQLRF